MGRFIPNEESWIAFAPSLTGTIAAPKLADITGATDITGFIQDIDASSTGNVLPTPSLDTLFETSIIGTSTATFTSNMYQDNATVTDPGDGNVAWNLFPRKTEGYVFIRRFGGVPAVGDSVEVWPIRVSSRKASNLQNNTVQTFALTCAVPVEPNEDAVVAT